MTFFKKHGKAIFYIACTLLLIGSFAAICQGDITAKRSDMGRSSIVLRPTTEALAFGASDTTQTFSINFNGFINSYAVVMPNFTNSVTGNLKITDSGSRDVYDSSGSDRDESDFAKNATTHVYGLRDVITIAGVNTVTLTLSGAPGGEGGTVYVTFWLE